MSACDHPRGSLTCVQPAGHEFGHVYHGTTDDIGDHGHHSDEVDL